jgi:hypothetical protein
VKIGEEPPFWLLIGARARAWMCRGDIPFCSEDCRQQQIEADEARERGSKQPAAAKGERERRQRRQSSSPKRIPLWAR